jgi:pimeloyl-ACP methyl ester carboxylesterase/DNA-binding CsgD family transcriptional regulator
VTTAGAYDVGPMAQQVRFCRTSEGGRLAYGADGAGPVLLRAPYYLHHLELDARCEVWRPYVEEFTRAHSLVRHDQRGFGLSDTTPQEQTLEAWVSDLEAVVDAAGAERFALFGMCYGGPVAVEYAARHPERVSHVVLFGAYARGAMKRGNLTPEAHERRELFIRIAELGWGQDNAAFQQVWPVLLQPNSTLARLRSLADLQRTSDSGPNVGRALRAAGELDVSESCAKVRCPTLVFHPRDDRAVPFEEGRILASLIPAARLVALDSANHAITEDEPAWKEFVSELRAFLPAGRPTPSFDGLTPREAEILERIAQGLDNAQIAAHLDMSEKTVRNHITRIFDKLGVENRGQAIVRAREAGLGVKNALA